MSTDFIVFSLLCLFAVIGAYLAVAVAAWLGAEWEERNWRKNYRDDRGRHNVE